LGGKLAGSGNEIPQTDETLRVKGNICRYNESPFKRAWDKARQREVEISGTDYNRGNGKA